jgi:putative transposase
VSLSRCCRLFGISRQSIYQSEERSRTRRDRLKDVRPMVQEIRKDMPRLGTRKLYHLLKNEFVAKGLKLGRDALFDHLRSEQLLVRPRKNYTKTTDSKHWLKKHPNLLAGARVSRPEEVFVSDITYVKSRERTYYLALVTDAYSRKIMGYHLSDDLSAENTVTALKMAIRNRVGDRPLIHHSDRGLQYASAIYQDELRRNNIRPSMTDGYDCYQNALAERMNGILKQEFLFEVCSTREELQALVEESIETYNRSRPHSSLAMKTPDLVHEEARETSFAGFSYSI